MEPKPDAMSALDLSKLSASSQSSNLSKLKKLGNYSLIKKIGEGGMGAVFLAEDVIAQRIVALKVLPLDKVNHPNAVARFQREAKAIGKLNHPNIIQAYALGEENGFHFYAMERCDGKPLDSILEKKKRLSCERALTYITQAARGLEHAHAHDIIHRDIKPGNLFVTGEGVVKILDLGLSKDIAADHEQSFLTGTGTVLGTPYYISSEQAMGKTDFDGRTDIYSLGATLYHLVTGQTPFSGSTAAVVVSKHLIEKLPNPQDITPGIPDNVVRVIQRMMAKEPDSRYANCAELLEDLEALAAGKDPAAGELPAEMTSILPRSGLNPAVPSGPEGSISLSEKLSGVSFGAKVLAVCGGCALLLLLFVVRAVLSKPAEVIAPTDIPVTAQIPSEETVPQWTSKELPPPLPSEVPAAAPAVPTQVARAPEGPVAKPVEKDKAGFKDILQLVDPRKSVAGEWKVVNGALISEPSRFARIGVPYDLPKDYDVKFEFGAVGGELALMFPSHGRPVVLMISALTHGCLLGSPLDRAPRWTNLGSFDFSKRHTAIVEIRNDSARLFLDNFHDAQATWIFEQAAPESKEFPWRVLDATKLGIGTNRSGSTIYSLQIRDASK